MRAETSASRLQAPAVRPHGATATATRRSVGGAPGPAAAATGTSGLRRPSAPASMARRRPSDETRGLSMHELHGGGASHIPAPVNAAYLRRGSGRTIATTGNPSAMNGGPRRTSSGSLPKTQTPATKSSIPTPSQPRRARGSGSRATGDFAAVTNQVTTPTPSPTKDDKQPHEHQHQQQDEDEELEEKAALSPAQQELYQQTVLQNGGAQPIRQRKRSADMMELQEQLKPHGQPPAENNPSTHAVPPNPDLATPMTPPPRRTSHEAAPEPMPLSPPDAKRVKRPTLSPKTPIGASNYAPADDGRLSASQRVRLSLSGYMTVASLTEQASREKPQESELAAGLPVGTEFSTDESLIQAPNASQAPRSCPPALHQSTSSFARSKFAASRSTSGPATRIADALLPSKVAVDCLMGYIRELQMSEARLRRQLERTRKEKSEDLSKSMMRVSTLETTISQVESEREKERQQMQEQQRMIEQLMAEVSQLQATLFSSSQSQNHQHHDTSPVEYIGHSEHQQEPEHDQYNGSSYDSGAYYNQEYDASALHPTQPDGQCFDSPTSHLEVNQVSSAGDYHSDGQMGAAVDVAAESFNVASDWNETSQVEANVPADADGHDAGLSSSTIANELDSAPAQSLPSLQSSSLPTISEHSMLQARATEATKTWTAETATTQFLSGTGVADSNSYPMEPPASRVDAPVSSVWNNATEPQEKARPPPVFMVAPRLSDIIGPLSRSMIASALASDENVLKPVTSQALSESRVEPTYEDAESFAQLFENDLTATPENEETPIRPSSYMEPSPASTATIKYSEEGVSNQFPTSSATAELPPATEHEHFVPAEQVFKPFQKLSLASHKAAPGALTSAPTPTTQSLEKLLSDFFSSHDKNKVKMAAVYSKRYKGREDKLFAELSKRYGAAAIAELKQKYEVREGGGDGSSTSGTSAVTTPRTPSSKSVLNHPFTPPPLAINGSASPYMQPPLSPEPENSGIFASQSPAQPFLMSASAFDGQSEPGRSPGGALYTPPPPPTKMQPLPSIGVPATPSFSTPGSLKVSPRGPRRGPLLPFALSEGQEDACLPAIPPPPAVTVNGPPLSSHTPPAPTTPRLAPSPPLGPPPKGNMRSPPRNGSTLRPRVSPARAADQPGSLAPPMPVPSPPRPAVSTEGLSQLRSAASRSSPLATSTASGSVPITLDSLLREFYRKHQPDKLKNVPLLVQQFTGKERDLIAQLKAKYGALSVKMFEQNLSTLELQNRSKQSPTKIMKKRKRGCFGRLLSLLYTVAILCVVASFSGVLLIAHIECQNGAVDLDREECAGFAQQAISFDVSHVSDYASRVEAKPCFCDQWKAREDVLRNEPTFKHGVNLLQLLPHSRTVVEPAVLSLYGTTVGAVNWSVYHDEYVKPVLDFGEPYFVVVYENAKPLIDISRTYISQSIERAEPVLAEAYENMLPFIDVTREYVVIGIHEAEPLIEVAKVHARHGYVLAQEFFDQASVVIAEQWALLVEMYIEEGGVFDVKSATSESTTPNVSTMEALTNAAKASKGLIGQRESDAGDLMDAKMDSAFVEPSSPDTQDIEPVSHDSEVVEGVETTGGEDEGVAAGVEVGGEQDEPAWTTVEVVLEPEGADIKFGENVELLGEHSNTDVDSDNTSVVVPSARDAVLDDINTVGDVAHAAEEVASDYSEVIADVSPTEQATDALELPAYGSDRVEEFALDVVDATVETESIDSAAVDVSVNDGTQVDTEDAIAADATNSKAEVSHLDSTYGEDRADASESSEDVDGQSQDEESFSGNAEHNADSGIPVASDQLDGQGESADAAPIEGIASLPSDNVSEADARVDVTDLPLEEHDDERDVADAGDSLTALQAASGQDDDASEEAVVSVDVDVDTSAPTSQNADSDNVVEMEHAEDTDSASFLDDPSGLDPLELLALADLAAAELASLK